MTPTSTPTQVVCKGATSRTDWFCVDSPYDAIAAMNSAADPALTTLSTGAAIHVDPESPAANSTAMIAEAVRAAKAAEAVVFVIGGDWDTEHEAMDRQSIALPGNQAALIAAVAAAVGPAIPLVAVMIHGGSMDIGSVLNHTHAVLDSFYPGMYGATAIAETLFGVSTPGGKLPYTYYKSSYTSRISMDEFGCAVPPGRGYRYMAPSDPDILLPFAHGQSYTRFSMALPPSAPRKLLLRAAGTALLNISVVVSNIGKVFTGTETVFAFFRPLNRTNPGSGKLLPS